MPRFFDRFYLQYSKSTKSKRSLKGASLLEPYHALWKLMFKTWGSSSSRKNSPQPHFDLNSTPDLSFSDWQLFPPKLLLVFLLAVLLIFVQATGELTKQLGGWCFGPTGCKSQGQSQRCISWLLDPDVTPSWHLCPQQDKRTGEIAHDTLQKIIETPSTSLHLKDISSLCYQNHLTFHRSLILA